MDTRASAEVGVVLAYTGRTLVYTGVNARWRTGGWWRGGRKRFRLPNGHASFLITPQPKMPSENNIASDFGAGLCTRGAGGGGGA